MPITRVKSFDAVADVLGYQRDVSFVAGSETPQVLEEDCLVFRGISITEAAQIIDALSTGEVAASRAQDFIGDQPATEPHTNGVSDGTVAKAAPSAKEDAKEAEAKAEEKPKRTRKRRSSKPKAQAKPAPEPEPEPEDVEGEPEDSGEADQYGFTSADLSFFAGANRTREAMKRLVKVLGAQADDMELEEIANIASTLDCPAFQRLNPEKLEKQVERYFEAEEA